MKKFRKIASVLMLAVAVVFAAGCTKPDEPNNGGNENEEVSITVYTFDPRNITETTADCGCGVTLSPQSIRIAELGLCWGTHENPTVSGLHHSINDGTTTTSFALEDLEPNTKYHVRAYVLYNDKYYYGEDKNFTTLEHTGGGSGFLNGHEYLDLGLPSGTLWATCNVGADAPEDCGDYFAWGETSPKDFYDWSNYQYGSDWNKLTKYCSHSDEGLNGFVDNLTTLEASDDAAAANWGDGWYMPSKDQLLELRDNTTPTWITQNGVEGMLFTASNGNSVFLPATGYYLGSVPQSVGGFGHYWSNSRGENTSFEAYYISFNSSNSCLLMSYGRNYGRTVRPVCSAK